MKRIFSIVILFVFVLCISKSYAQNFNSGMKLGTNFTQVDGDNLGGYKKIGFTGGLFVNYNFDDRNAVQFEILYSTKGSRSSLNIKSESYTDYQIRLNYIDLPVLYSLEVMDKLRLETGLMPSVLIKGDELINGGSEQAVEFKRLDLGYLIGATFLFSESFSITGRFSYSLLNIRKTDINDTMHSLLGRGQFNNVISLTLNYHF